MILSILVSGAYNFGSNFAEGNSAFTLSDTNSLPIRAEDYDHPRTWESTARAISELSNIRGPQKTRENIHNSFAIKCVQIVATFRLTSDNILITGNPFRIIEPQPYLYTLYTPFFFVDNRNVFYVTTSWHWVMIPDYYYYGVLRQVASPAKTVMIPPLVTQSMTTVRGGGSLVTSRQLSRSEPVNIQRFITANAYIRVAPSVGSTIPYGGRQIGLSGNLTSVANSRNRNLQGEER